MSGDPRPAAVPWAQVVLLTLLWGTNWSLFPLAVREVSVWTFRAIAVVLAGTALLAWSRWKGLPLAIPRREWRPLLWATFVYLFFWNIASTYAAVMIPSGQAAILGFTMPLWAALLSWALFGERPNRRMAVAIGLGSAGVGLLMVRGAAAYAQAPLGFALGLAAGVGWAGGTLIVKRSGLSIAAPVLAGWQLLLSAPAVALGAWVAAPAGAAWFVPSASSLLVIAYIALVPMGVGNATWFSIVGKLPTNVAGLSSIAVPVVAMVTGAIVHREPLGPLEIGAMACCVTGLSLALLRRG